LVSKILSQDPSTDATQRTTTADTIVDFGIKVNFVPNVARAFINHQIHHSETAMDVLKQNGNSIKID